MVKMNAETFFTAAEQERIRSAVVAAEQKTAGEIVPMLVNASGRYAEVEMSGLAIGLVLGTLAALFVHDPWSSAEMHMIWPLAGALLGYLLSSALAIKRHFLSKSRIDESVHLRSLAAFTANGLHHTREHTGILIFVSSLEHRVVVLADRGINQKVSAGTWDEIVHLITSGIKSGDACDAFCQAIERCGAILAEHFPRSADDRDELPNQLVTK
jgi:putative membrane protein